MSDEPQPGPAVCEDMKMSGAHMAMMDLQRLVANDDGGSVCLVASKGKVIGGVEPFRLPALECVRQSGKKSRNGVWAQAVPHELNAFMRKMAGDVISRIGARDNIDGLNIVQQGFDDLRPEGAAAQQKRCDHFFAGRTDGQTIRGLVVGAVGQALPHGG